MVDELNMTRGTRKIIKSVVAEHLKKNGRLNTHELLDELCELLCTRFSGDSLDYQLQRMKLTTTLEVMDAIDYYMIKYYKHDFENT